MTTILHLSDLHVEPRGRLAYGREDTFGRVADVARHALDLARSIRADALVVTGDVACDGNEEAYARVAEVFEPFAAAGVPVRMLPGNHDRRAAMKRGLAGMFGECWFEDRLDQTVPAGCARLLLLDTLQPGLHHGGLPDAALDRLARELEDPSPAMVFSHHTPLACGLGVMDEPFGNAERLLETLARRPDVRLATGHMHRAIIQSAGPNVVVTAPPAALAIPLDFSADGGGCFMLEPAGWAVHQLRDGRWNSFVGYFPMQADYSGPYPFSGAVNPV